MKRLIVFALGLILLGPGISRAQNENLDEPNTTQYRDVDDGQPLKLVSYILTPFGMALEWGLMRPLHYLATQTSAAPLLSGDKGSPFFTNNDNGNQVPAGTFAPPVINPTNNIQASNNKSPSVSATGTLAAPESIPPSKALSSGNQPALH
ncbi:MAG: hypothetical protein JO166_23210 [Deltaproteobacteria bacterium]|nr:hypothetical protein [Deltaproteobacteria bacterium]